MRPDLEMVIKGSGYFVVSTHRPRMRPDYRRKKSMSDTILFQLTGLV